MNFLSHGRDHLHSPYLVAGTAVPDWLSVVTRRVRARSKYAEPFLDDDDAAVRDVAAGIMRHHTDDAWFHASREFNETNLQFAVELRDRLPGDDGFRPSFVGHILVEMLIDATLMGRDGDLADRYYAAIESVDSDRVETIVTRMMRYAGREQSLVGLAMTIRRFATERFLYDYADDGKLLVRLNQVMRRVGMPPLPETLLPWLADARHVIDTRCDSLLRPPS